MTTEILANRRPYIHRQSAHCETGVTSALFLDKGVDISEPMVFGISGMRYLAKKIVKSNELYDFNEACRQLAHVVRMQEEIGSGGAGFRYIYAAFLQEADELFGSSQLADLSAELTAIGDIWREFAVVSARIVKQRGQSEETFAKAGGLMLVCAGREEQLFKDLNHVVRKLKA